MDKPMILLSPTAILGYGFPESSFSRGLSLNPDLIAVDAGSTDPGPYYLGSGSSFVPRGAVKRDLAYLLRAALSRRIPLLIGTAGGSGAKPHLSWCREILLELAREEGLSFRMAVIPADIPKSFLLEALAAGKVSPLGPAPELSEADVIESSYLVAQMGAEPLIAALEGGADVVLAGRCYDPAVFAALPIKQGYPAGLALHLGKILECAAIAALPGSGSDCMIGILEGERFMVEPASLERRATVDSVAAHTLYEKSDPYRLPGPGGLLDLSESAFAQVDDRRVEVRGSRFHPSSTCTVKVEGAKLIGYRVISIAGARDPRFIAALDEIIAGVKERTHDNFSGEAGRFKLIFHVYGRDGVMGKQEPQPRPGHEVGIVIEAVAETPDLAEAILGFARSTMLHYGFPGRISTAGNLAFPYSPSDFKVGGAYVFSVYHLMTVDCPEELFPIIYEEVR
ncbi:MAG TPA: acyclic terpene utilization AtuA family protein [Bacillota bacterium]|nr:acyclic terpene utilization AtuA family protein [Bacillota bacterium]HOL15702.1 acyclic terpene utilization AtuA family protein [Bacillota bacterium]